MSWTETVGTGGPTSGRFRGVHDAVLSRMVLVERKASTTDVRRFHLSDDTAVTGSVASNGGNNAGLYGLSINLYDLNADGLNDLGIGGWQDNTVTDRPYLNYVVIGGAFSGAITTGAGDAQGASFGLSHELFTLSGNDTFALVSSTTATSNASFEWIGGTGLPATTASTQININSSDSNGAEGCVVNDRTTPRSVGFFVTNAGVIRSSEIDSVGVTTLSTTPTGWTTGANVEIGQCFMVGTRAVGVVYDTVRDETAVVIIGTTPSVEQSQVIAGKVLGGATLDGVGYLIGVDGTLYSSDGTTTFADASDDFSAGTPLHLGLNGAGDAITVWDATGKIWERTPTVAAPSSGPWGVSSWGAPWGGSW